MGSKRAISYTSGFKEQIFKECIETNKYNVVAMKHNLPVTTVYAWIKRDKIKPEFKILKEFSNGGGYQKLNWKLNFCNQGIL